MEPERLQISDRADALRETLMAIFVLGEHSREHLGLVLRKVAPEDVAEVLGDFSPEEKVLIFKALPQNEARGAVLEGTDHQSRREILEGLSERERIEVLGEMPVDDLVDHLEEMPVEEQAKVIATLEEEEAKDVEELLQFAPDTAGGMMNPQFIAIPVSITSREALQTIQGNLKAEVIAYVYVLDPGGMLRGVVSIRNILQARPETPIERIMTPDPIAVRVDTDREEVAALVDKYNHAALPVVDAEGRMKGVITFDDVFDAVQEEHSEDMLRMAGTVAVNPLYEPTLVGVWKRLPFLVVTMFGGFGILLVKNLFEHEIPAALFTASLGVIPLLSGLSGNVAIVSSTIMVRGLATGDVNLLRAWRALGKEVTVGIVLGILLASLVTGTLTVLESESYGPRVGLAVAVGLSTSVTWAAFLGGIIPLMCKLTGVIDPAIASGPFVTMLCDLSASAIFLFLVYSLLVR